MSAQANIKKPTLRWHYLIWLMGVLVLIISLFINKRLVLLRLLSSSSIATTVTDKAPQSINKNSAHDASLSLKLNLAGTASFSALTVGKTYQTEVIIDTKNWPVAGADAYLTYDPAVIQVNAIKPGTIFSTYPAAMVSQKEEGKITLSGITGMSETYTGTGVLGTIEFTPLAAGETSIDFIFELNNTTDSNVSGVDPARDILGTVKNLSLTIK